MRATFRMWRGAVATLRGTSVDFSPQRLGRHVDPTGLAGYYCDFRHKAEWAERYGGMPRNMHGIPCEWVIPIAQAALGYWELRLEGRQTERQFTRLADWLLANARPRLGGVVWPIDLPVAKFELAPGWTSAMGQGQAASVLLRAHSLTGRAEYLDHAHAALAPLLVEVKDGGLMRVVDGHPVMEEYPSERPAAVLNGWTFSLFGVHELGRVAGNERARELFERSAAGLVELLPRYDTGWWSLYSLYDLGRPDLAKPFYQRLHPVLLSALSALHPEPSLGYYAKRWQSQLTAAGMARASANKILYRFSRERRQALAPQA
ncbi:MAG TPA: D-glucuronyl C5-epimerase family protein [Thermoleophilaceae bacterium]|nr:D-glucuronyl C5-epimerase family protein [Thermoleophilaceae bacterium]